MLWLLIILVTVVLYLVMNIASSVGDSRRNAAKRALIGRDFSGVVIKQSLMAHPFDAGYSCRIVIRCDDGSTVHWDTSAAFLDRIPVGTRVTHTAEGSAIDSAKGSAEGTA